MKPEPTTGEAIKMLAAMLVIAEKAKDVHATARYANRIGNLLNALNKDAMAWTQGKPSCCPKCGGDLESAHYATSPGTDECSVPHCTECSWMGEPE